LLAGDAAMSHFSHYGYLEYSGIPAQSNSELGLSPIL